MQFDKIINYICDKLRHANLLLIIHAMIPQISFSDTQQNKFSIELRKRVDAYFKQNNIKKTGELKLLPKTILILLSYFVPYALILSGWFTFPINLLLYVLFGIGLAGMGMSIMHDAVHGAYSSNKNVNKLMGLVLNLVGGHAMNWKIQHNYLHHSFTNIEGFDEDIKSRGLFRFHSDSKRLFFHRFQHIYFIIFYGLLTITWPITDLQQLLRYNKHNLVKKHDSNLTKEIFILILSKVVFVLYLFLIPYWVLSVPFWHILLGFVVMQFVGGLILAVIFQLAHIQNETGFPKPDTNNTVHADWAVHQLITTADFAPNNKLLFWYSGGLNFQVEHHLFPKISHIHYPAIAKIVQQTAQEFNVPYNQHKTFFKALASHIMYLYKMGKTN